MSRPHARCNAVALVDRLHQCLAPYPALARYWVAFSGGLDSSVLLQVVASARASLPGVVAAVHLDHGLHPRSADWAAHCAAVCAALGVPAVCRRLELAPRPGESLEAVARAARYRALAELLGPADAVLAAHHQDDQAETLMLALLRGSGPAGLAAMPAASVLGEGLLLRPFLEVPRAVLEDYAHAAGLVWIEDPSNGDWRHDRNYLRHQIMPRLRARWPASTTTLARAAGHCADAAGLLDERAGQRLDAMPGSRPGSLPITALLALPRPWQQWVLRAWLRRQGLPLPDSRHLARILDELIPAAPAAAPKVSWRGCEIRRYRGELFAMPPLPSPPATRWVGHWCPAAEGACFSLPQGLGRLEWQGSPVGCGIVTIGFIQPSVRGHAELATGSRGQRLKKRFQAVGVPSWLRPYVPLVLVGGQLVAIGDQRWPGPARGRMPPTADIRWRGHPWQGILGRNPVAWDARTAPEGRPMIETHSGMTAAGSGIRGLPRSRA